MSALGQTLDKSLPWRTSRIGAGYVRTAVCKNGAILVETFLADRGRAGCPERTYRAVCIPASIARAVVEGMRAGLAGDENGEANE